MPYGRVHALYLLKREKVSKDVVIDFDLLFCAVWLSNLLALERKAIIFLFF